MKRVSMLLSFAFLAGFASVSQGGLMSLLASGNTANDVLNDNSLGVIERVSHSNNTPQVGDIAWGLIEISTVKPGGLSAVSTLGKVYMVYAVTFGTQLDPTNDPFKWSYNPAEAKLNSLLGTTAFTGTNAMAAVVEFAGTASSAITNLPWGDEDLFASVTQLQSAITEVSNNANVLFAFGLNSNESDLFETSNSGELTNGGRIKLNVNAKLSVTYAAPGINLSDFKELFGIPGHEGALVKKGTQVLNTTIFNSNGFILTNDSGNYGVNYVPEPASMIGLASLALAGAGLGFVRRRKA